MDLLAMSLLQQAVVALLGTALGLAVWAGLVGFWAPRFGGRPGWGRALRLAWHTAWPAALAALLALMLAFASVWLAALAQLAGGLLAIRRLRAGLPPGMQVPEPRAWRCTAAIVGTALLLCLVLLLGRCATPSGGPTSPLAQSPTALVPAPAGSSPPGAPGKRRSRDDDSQGGGVGSLVIDPEAARRAWEGAMAAASAAMVEGGPVMAPPASGVIPLRPVQPSRLAELLPEALCGLQRRSLQSRLVQLPPTPKGVPQDHAEALAEYRAVGANVGPVLRMTIADRTPAAGVFASLKQSGLLVQDERRTRNGWLRMHLEAGTLIEERWDSARHEDAARALVADRYLVSALVLQAPSPACAGQAVRAVDWRKLQAWADSASQ